MSTKRKKKRKSNIKSFYNFSEEELEKLFKKKKYKAIVDWDNDKTEVRKTKQWLELKCFCYNRQDGKDPLTNSALTKSCNLHHCDLHEDNYGIFNSDNFVLLNQYSHKFLHWAAQQCHKLGKEEFLERLEVYIDLMEKLNSDMKMFPLAR